jgi:type I restriction enzyme, S subunit
MSLPRYAEYKDSGVVWLGEVPAHWSWVNLKWISKRYSGGTPDKTRLEYWEEGTVPWLNSGAVNDQKITEPSTYITEQALDNSSAKWIPEGALVMALAGQGKTKGMVAQVLFETTCNQSMAAIVPSTEVCERYLYWWLVRNYQNIRNMAGGDLRDGLNLELLGSIPCPLPLVSEQSAIAAFLDRETGKIDALIAEQEKLLTLLAEKRQATISHAVTRGLNPNAPMKDSGLPWLGEVLANWDVCAIKRMTAVITDGAHVSPETEGGIYDFVSTRDVGDAGVDFDGALKTSASSYEYLVRTGCKPQRGDILFSKDGTIGRTVVVDEEREFVVASSLIIIRPDARVLDGLFLHYLCQSFVVRQQVDGFVKGAGLPRLSIQNLTKVLGVFPSLPQQHEIAQFLKATDNKWSALKANAERAIALLKERRSALIAAAVTGKIDVRNTSQTIEDARA